MKIEKLGGVKFHQVLGGVSLALEVAFVKIRIGCAKYGLEFGKINCKSIVLIDVYHFCTDWGGADYGEF